VQFCLPIARSWAFPTGDSVVAARVRDVDGQVSLPQEIVVRVLAPAPTTAATRPPTPVPARATPTAHATIRPVVATPTWTGVAPTDLPSTRTPTTTPGPSDAAPAVTYLGFARADEVVVGPTTTDTNGRPVYLSSDFGMILVVEARPGSPQVPVGREAFDASGGLPDLQILVSAPLGNGSPKVCDKTLPSPGGVPATDPLIFSDTPSVIDAINDLGCRVDDGAGQPLGRSSTLDACTIPNAASAEFAFVRADSTTQYCLPIDRAWAFAPGDTIVAARVRDRSGVVGLPKEIVVRVAASDATLTPVREPSTATPVAVVAIPTGSADSPTPMPSSATPRSGTSTPIRMATQPTPHPSQATSTPTAPPMTTPGHGPVVTYVGVARADGVPLDAATSDADGRPVYARASGSGMILVIEARPGGAAVSVGTHAFDPTGGVPDLQLLVSQPLGDGSSEVCDKTLPNAGGVPATDPPVFSDLPAAINAMNDLGCRVDDGTGEPLGRVDALDACTVDAVSALFGFVNASSTIQYCLPIASAWGFPTGDTVVAARVRDIDGTVGLPSEIVLRVAATTPAPD